MTKVNINSENSKQNDSNSQPASGSDLANENSSTKASEDSAKAVSGTHSSVEPATKNADTTKNIGGYGDRDAWNDDSSDS